MKNIIIGTAGHVDHGKTALIRALTGIETDRLKEEKKRGITIELGFAYLDLPDGEKAGIIDVPGHEKFIKNMLAGAGGMDLVLLVVAADDGVMPQTREHLGILNLLDARSGIIVLTKCDLVDEDWVELVSEDIREAVAGSFLGDAPIVPVSSHTGRGIDTLRTLIYEKGSETSAKHMGRPFRVPVDRVFSVEGFGTVITGTLTEGTLREGDEVEIYPAGVHTRVRNLQVHGGDVDTAYAGQRVAVNLASLSREDVARGDTLAAPGSLTGSLMLDVTLRILDDCQRDIRNGSRLHFYHGTRDVLCKLALLDSDRLGPGEEGYAQLRFSEEIAVKKGDHFVVRFYSPLETVGGGVVLDPVPVKHRRGSAKVIEALKVREHGSDAEHILQAIADHARQLAPLADIQKQFGLDQTAFKAELDALAAEGQITLLGTQNAIDAEYRAALGETLRKLLSGYHRENPLQEGMRKDELRSRLLPGHKPALCDRVLDLFVDEALIRYTGQKVALATFEITYSDAERKLRGDIEKRFAAGGFTPPAFEDIYAVYPAKEKKAVEQVLEAMLAEGALVTTEPGICFAAAVVEDAKTKFRAAAEAGDGQVTLAQFRDATGSSRKYALSLLESFDRSGLTRKVGDARVPVKI